MKILISIAAAIIIVIAVVIISFKDMTRKLNDIINRLY
jgi:cell division protein FtsL